MNEARQAAARAIGREAWIFGRDVYRGELKQVWFGAFEPGPFPDDFDLPWSRDDHETEH